MAPATREMHAQRMRLRNPMRDPEVKAKARVSRLAAGNWKPPVQGGNGRGMSKAQATLLAALGPPWIAEAIVVTGKAKGLPRHFKLDLAWVERKVAVEVDGQSHRALTRQAQDRKKEKFLRGLGWTVLRFSNREVMGRLAECVRTVSSTTSR